ncbi:MAG: Clp protease ClpP [Bacteroidaceae bacterium]|nr:Clp protease ClpP [Bacteroidaceae bacterium]
MAKTNYLLHLKGYVGGYDFDRDYVDYVLAKNPDTEVHVLIDSLGGSLATALSIVAAFRQHGNVHVHFVGMNASAATIVSLGAKHVSIDNSAMYLVHKCSIEFFRWASANSDKLADIIKEAKQMKSDLEKMDANVAQMYAAKCQKSKEDLLELMKKGGWLTAQEAKDWGFVDEITDYEEDAAPVITDAIAADMAATGIPVPAGLNNQPANLFARFVDALTNFFNNSKPHNQMEQVNNNAQQEQQQVQQQQQQQQQQGATDSQAQEHEQQHTAELEAKDREIERLRAELDALKKAPGASTSKVVENDKGGAHEEQPSQVEAFFATRQRAIDLYAQLP